jgi:hypothetical protein
MLTQLLRLVPEWAFFDLRVLLVASTLTGSAFAVWCYFDARREWKLYCNWVAQHPELHDELAEVMTEGQVMDMRRLSIAQGFLFLAAATALVVAAPGSGAGAPVLVWLVPASLTLTWKTFRQVRRRQFLLRPDGGSLGHSR